MVKNLIGILIGASICIVGFFVLSLSGASYKYSAVAKKAIEVDSTVESGKDDRETEGKIVSVRGVLETSGAADEPFIKHGPYLVIKRKAEMSCYREFFESRGTKGNRRRVPRYEKGWSETPEDSSKFVEKEDHENPKMKIGSRTAFAEKARLGSWTIERPRLLDFDRLAGLVLSREILSDSMPVEVKSTGTSYIFLGSGSLEHPKIGDIRLSYAALEGGETVTVIGLAKGNVLLPPQLEEGKTFFVVTNRTREALIKDLASSEDSTIRLINLIGLSLVIIGLAITLGCGWLLIRQFVN
jgi:hypothetical protein